MARTLMGATMAVLLVTSPTTARAHFEQGARSDEQELLGVTLGIAAAFGTTLSTALDAHAAVNRRPPTPSSSISTWLLTGLALSSSTLLISGTQNDAATIHDDGLMLGIGVGMAVIGLASGAVALWRLLAS